MRFFFSRESQKFARKSEKIISKTDVSGFRVGRIFFFNPKPIRSGFRITGCTSLSNFMKITNVCMKLAKDEKPMAFLCFTNFLYVVNIAGC